MHISKLLGATMIAGAPRSKSTTPGKDPRPEMSSGSKAALLEARARAPRDLLRRRARIRA
jgi:hypothetical protein